MTTLSILQLSQGTLVHVAPSLVKRRKTHFHNLPCGASIILGNNGYVWICPTVNEDTDHTGGFIENTEVLTSWLSVWSHDHQSGHMTIRQVVLISPVSWPLVWSFDHQTSSLTTSLDIWPPVGSVDSQSGDLSCPILTINSII